jgi:arsenate reductase-like glutaredoxin family protein
MNIKNTNVKVLQLISEFQFDININELEVILADCIKKIKLYQKDLIKNPQLYNFINFLIEEVTKDIDGIELLIGYEKDFWGRKEELQELNNFYNASAKKIFAFYGVAQMGKSKTILAWLEKQSINYHLFTFSENSTIEDFYQDVFNQNKPNNPYKIFKDFKKMVFWFENTEEILQRKVNYKIHKIKPAFYDLMKELAKYDVKIICESRYMIDFENLKDNVITLSNQQLKALDAQFFKQKYIEKGFSEKEFKHLYNKTQGNTWLMRSILNNFEDEYYDVQTFLESIMNFTFEEYKIDYLTKTLNTLNDTESELLFRASLMYRPIQQIHFPNIPLQDFISLSKKLLLDVSQRTYLINGYVRETCRLYFKSLSNQNLIEKFKVILKEQEKEVGKQYTAVLSITERIDKFEFLCEEVPTFIPYHIELAKACYTNNDINRANQIIATALLQNNLTKSTKTILFSNLLHFSATFESASLIFNEMKAQKLKPNAISYNTLINKSERFADAKLFFEEMKAQGLTLDAISYSTLINKSERFADAKLFFEEMKAQGLTLDAISYSTLIKKADTLEQQKPFYQTFLKQFPLRKGNFKSEKNYNFLFTALFKKVKNKQDWDFVQAEVYRLGLKMNDYTQKFYDNLQRKYGKM